MVPSQMTLHHSNTIARQHLGHRPLLTPCTHHIPLKYLRWTLGQDPIGDPKVPVDPLACPGVVHHANSTKGSESRTTPNHLRNAVTGLCGLAMCKSPPGRAHVVHQIPPTRSCGSTSTRMYPPEAKKTTHGKDPRPSSSSRDHLAHLSIYHLKATWIEPSHTSMGAHYALGTADVLAWYVGCDARTMISALESELNGAQVCTASGSNPNLPPRSPPSPNLPAPRAIPSLQVLRSSSIHQKAKAGEENLSKHPSPGTRATIPTPARIPASSQGISQSAFSS